ncbi:hypothetical protein [Brachybacterium paraconglomeratum]|uniref:hypothetical protein n=1 Tax=Brachybacterium paraconglomeratum TaxID=173362 RepID=UPI0022B04E5C|nr:hypothetical protein [Brachybacterium paraconglomeratum]MCZ4325689.1 hypothetical protein [Brachybacterium paraconglomeratum]
MTTVRDIDTALQRRRFHQLRGVPKWRVELVVRPGVTQSAEADTVEAAWKAVVASASILLDVEVTSECPFDEKGRVR